jgi:UDP-N-acetylmuramate--alanine ligase
LFDIDTPQGIINDFSFALPGRHNLMNALMAIAMAVNFGTQPMPLALTSFKGVRRRFSYQIKTQNLVYIDDYAHHPTEINAVHQAVRELYLRRG